MPNKLKSNEAILSGLRGHAQSAGERICQILVDGGWRTRSYVQLKLVNEISPEYWRLLKMAHIRNGDIYAKQSKWFNAKVASLERAGRVERNNPNGGQTHTGNYSIKITRKGWGYLGACSRKRKKPTSRRRTT